MAGHEELNRYEDNEFSPNDDIQDPIPTRSLKQESQKQSHKSHATSKKQPSNKSAKEEPQKPTQPAVIERTDSKENDNQLLKDNHSFGAILRDTKGTFQGQEALDQSLIMVQNANKQDKHEEIHVDKSNPFFNDQTEVGRDKKHIESETKPLPKNRIQSAMPPKTADDQSRNKLYQERLKRKVNESTGQDSHASSNLTDKSKPNPHLDLFLARKIKQGRDPIDHEAIRLHAITIKAHQIEAEHSRENRRKQFVNCYYAARRVAKQQAESREDTSRLRRSQLQKDFHRTSRKERRAEARVRLD